MKIVIPTNNKDGLEDTVALHFGRCNTYTFLNQSGEVIEIIDNTSEHMGGTGSPPELMKKHGANVLLCKSLGRRALNLCAELKIKVFVSNAEKVKNIFQEWKENKIKQATPEDACDH